MWFWEIEKLIKKNAFYVRLRFRLHVSIDLDAWVRLVISILFEYVEKNRKWKLKWHKMTSIAKKTSNETPLQIYGVKNDTYISMSVLIIISIVSSILLITMLIPTILYQYYWCKYRYQYWWYKWYWCWYQIILCIKL